MVPSAAAVNLRIWRLLVAATVFAVMFFLRELILPLLIAALITFLLSPVVQRLQRRIGRTAAVIVAAGITFGAIGTFGWITATQVIDLAGKLPAYQENLRSKIADLEGTGPGPFSGLTQMVENLDQEKNAGTAAQPEPTPVQVVTTSPNSRFERLGASMAPYLVFLGPAGAVVVLALFMLVKREDLRDRIIQLIGRNHISRTTSAMIEAAGKVNSYLRMQLLVNLLYGIPVAAGLALIGVPNALLWGALAVVLRFIPYVGPLAAMIPPIILSLAVFDNWTGPLLTISLYVFLELLGNNVVEPWLYGSSTGISPFSLIVAALFWTWLWGIPGLVLSTPVTVCLLVIGTHVPSLAFFGVLLSDKGALSPADSCYHRLLSQDRKGLAFFVEERVKADCLAGALSETLLPALAMVENDLRRGTLDRERHEVALSRIDEALENSISLADSPKTVAEGQGIAEMPLLPLKVRCLPADTRADELAAGMLATALRNRGCDATSLSSKLLRAELRTAVAEDTPHLVWICAINPVSLNRCRDLSSDLASHVPDLRIGIAVFEPEEHLIPLLRSSEFPETECVLASFHDVLLRTETLRGRASEQYQFAPIPKDETERLQALLNLNLLNKDGEDPLFEKVTSELTRAFDVPISLVSLIDAESQIFGGQCGLPAELSQAGRSSRELSVCGHVAAANVPLVIPDLACDPRFAGNPFLREHKLRFYAGVPLRTRSGHAIGSLCILDFRPRTISDPELRLLEMISDNLMCDIEDRAKEA